MSMYCITVYVLVMDSPLFGMGSSRMIATHTPVVTKSISKTVYIKGIVFDNYNNKLYILYGLKVAIEAII